jgi:hypothetical protein
MLWELTTAQTPRHQLVVSRVHNSNCYTQNQIRVRKRSGSMDAITDGWNAINWPLITICESQTVNTSWPRSDSVKQISSARVKFRSCQQKIYCKHCHERIYLSSKAQHALMYPPPPPRKRQMLVSSARHLIGDFTESNNRLEFKRLKKVVWKPSLHWVKCSLPLPLLSSRTGLIIDYW